MVTKIMEWVSIMALLVVVSWRRSAPANAVEILISNTINAGTRLIEEGALLPESVRFESEPWTVLLHGG
jgi:hypothetical protein